MKIPWRMKFGVFLGPFHALGENPTLALARDLELIQWLDQLGYDEAWIGEHHSAGWEFISSPEVFIAAAAERTKHIKLGTGVISLPYHHPLNVANRMVLIDHLTRGRVLFGVGPGAFITDALAMGIDPLVQRERMAESLDVIMQLFRADEPVTYKSDWFELKNAQLQLKPFQRPHMPLAIAASVSPAGPVLAGKYGARVLSLTVPHSGEIQPKTIWNWAEESAAKHGQTVKREDWGLVVPIYLAETRKEALAEARVNGGRFLREYFERTLGRPASEGEQDKLVEEMAESGGWIIGSPDDAIAAIETLWERTGGFGSLLLQGVAWSTREKVNHSYELLMRYVAPQFQGTLDSLTRSNQFSQNISAELGRLRTATVDKARTDYEARKNHNS